MGEQVVYTQGVTFITSPAQYIPDSHCHWNTGSQNLAIEAITLCAYHKRWETQGERVNFTQEITISEEMTPIPYLILKVLAFMIIFSSQDMRTTHSHISF